MCRFVSPLLQNGEVETNVQQGGMGKPDITFPIMAMCTKELNVKGSFRYGSGDYQTAVDLVASGLRS
jgi:threonine dehydrogenase-like Zn-dependent dehydrogenase